MKRIETDCSGFGRQLNWMIRAIKRKKKTTPANRIREFQKRKGPLLLIASGIVSLPINARIIFRISKHLLENPGPTSGRRRTTPPSNPFQQPKQRNRSPVASENSFDCLFFLPPQRSANSPSKYAIAATYAFGVRHVAPSPPGEVRAGGAMLRATGIEAQGRKK